MITYRENIVALFDKISNFVDVKIFVLIVQFHMQEVQLNLENQVM